MKSSFLTLISAICLIPPTSSWADSDPLDRVSAYSLCIGPNGPLPGYFPIGLRGGGLDGGPHKVVYAGFNVWQVQPDNAGFPLGEAFRDEGEPEANLHEKHGFFYYTQGRSKLSLIRGGVKPPGKIGDYYFPPFIQEDGTPAKRGAGLVNLFDPRARQYFMDYQQALAKSSWGQAPVGSPTIFWGMDNEWEGKLDYSPEARTAYIEWLKKHFRNLDEINKAWGTKFASFEAIRDSKLPKTSEFDTRPGEFLAWHTFQAESFTNLLADSAEALHTSDPHRRPVIYKSTQQTIEYPFVKRGRLFDQVLFGERARAFGGGILGVNMYGAGDRQSYETNYMSNIARPLDDAAGTWGVMCPELNNHSGPGHQWGATYWRVLSNGLKAANLFTIGYEGATGDYDTFGHFGPDGKARDKMFYAARWAHMLHRTERLWTEAHPAPGVPRVAMLLPRRDIVLAERTTRRISKWAYPANHRVMVYGWLREQGYWVDVIPETKLDADFLKKHYDALVLTGAEHLSKPEAAAIVAFVEAGGVLLADEQAGRFDELHREHRALDSLLGVRPGEHLDEPTTVPAQGPLAGVTINGRIKADPIDAQVLMRDDAGLPLVFSRKAGKGRAIHLAFATGDLREDANLPVPVSVFSAAGSNETADTGDESTPQRSGAISQWLGDLLKDAGVSPACRITGVTPRDAAILRVEQPMVDSRGNTVVAVAVRGLSDPNEHVASVQLELPLPGGPWHHAVWGGAEDASLQVVEIKPLDGDIHQVTLPPIATAGMLYLMKDHDPLVGIPRINTSKCAIDGHAALVKPGESFPVCVQLANPSSATIPVGELRLAALHDWTVTPPSMPTRELAPGEIIEETFTVTPTSEKNLKPNWLYPLVARWQHDGEDRSIGAANVEVQFD